MFDIYKAIKLANEDSTLFDMTHLSHFNNAVDKHNIKISFREENIADDERYMELNFSILLSPNLYKDEIDPNSITLLYSNKKNNLTPIYILKFKTTNDFHNDYKHLKEKYIFIAISPNDGKNASTNNTNSFLLAFIRLYMTSKDISDKVYFGHILIKNKKDKYADKLVHVDFINDENREKRGIYIAKTIIDDIIFKIDTPHSLATLKAFDINAYCKNSINDDECK
jgi:hypothetical protein